MNETQHYDYEGPAAADCPKHHVPYRIYLLRPSKPNMEIQAYYCPRCREETVTRESREARKRRAMKWT